VAAAAARLPRKLRGASGASHGIKLDAYLRAYFANLDAADFDGREPRTLALMALSHLRLALQRRGGAVVRVFNPTEAEDGYGATHTVIQMVGEDMPFLVDTIGLALTGRSLALHFLAHPVLEVVRDRGGRLQSVTERSRSPGPPRAHLESFQYIEVDRIVDADVLRSLKTEIETSMRDVRVAFADWPHMQAAARQAAEDLNTVSRRYDARDVSETQALLEWMHSRHFTFLGYREYRLKGKAGGETLEAVEAGGLGILRPGHQHPSSTGRILASDIRRQSRSRELALVTKANFQSTVHRPGYVDYVGIKHFGPSGRLVGERRFLGLWTSAAYNTNPRDIPLVRHKVAQVVQHFALAQDSHDGKALQHILESFPRDELFQASVPELIRIVAGIFGLQERPRVRLLLRRDPFRRFNSCLIFVPRDQYNSVVRQRIERLVRDAFDAYSIESQLQITDSNLARMHIVARTLPAERDRVDGDVLEAHIAAAIRSWADTFKTALLTRFDEAVALTLYERYAPAFPAAYTEDFSGEAAAADVGFLESVEQQPDRLHLDIYRRDAKAKDHLFLKIFRGRDAIPISDLLPILEHMGLKVIAERPYALEFGTDRRAWIQDLELVMRPATRVKPPELDREIKSAFIAVWTGRMDSDGFNQLTLTTGVPWRMVTVLRAYARYLLQAGLPFSLGYIAQVLVGNPPLARAFTELFAARFDPAIGRVRRRTALVRLDGRIRAALEKVTGSDEDRILRAVWNAISATVRTNAYQTIAQSAEYKDYLSLKLESQRLRELPLPKPLYEIFVFSTRMEGAHLRMGHVARGGIRWSDRREDFRTEILGLMKAQQVKNTVIVPVGAKGGFVIKGHADAKECYRTLIRGLLDITDNIEGEKIVPPPATVRHDGDDAYLVVAADKGTATFSDIANALSTEYGYWLGDAFASGGSAGYDHKKMAITARGAWECVKRHFRELGIDIQNQDFSVAGIGDMGGDVFGNGMLQSRHIRLIAAFNHQHIFIDPNPHAARSFKERERLFKLPGSSWADYSPAALSKGGGVFARNAKSLALPKEAQDLLELPARATPNEVIKAILRSHVDLLWNGGIGTYVKAGGESHGDVGDRSNDALRIDAAELNCKVIGEGGNLGFSQLARIEYARRGGRLNTDFIDNSAGVNCSDLEVKLKILLNGAVRAGQITRAARDRLLVRMTDAVAALVLRNNYLQSQAISTAEFRARERLSESAYVMRALERSGDLDRSLEFLPSEEDIAERRKAGEGLSRPELAVILSYGKIWLYKALIRSDVPEDPYLSAELARYFPAPIQQRFAARLKRHRLRREIVATSITNSLINRMGPVFPVRAQEDTGAAPAAVARAYSIAREVFSMRSVWARIEALDNHIPAAAAYTAMFHTTRLLRHASYWLLTHHPKDLGIERAVRRYAAPIAALSETLGDTLTGTDRTRLESHRARLVEQHVPEDLAARIASLDVLHSALDLVEVAKTAGLDVGFAARVYFNLGERIGLTWIRDQIDSLAAEGQWQAVARGTLSDNLYELQRRLTASILAGKGGTAERRVDRWLGGHATGVDSLKRIVVDLRTGAAADFATLSVALQAVRRLAQE